MTAVTPRRSGRRRAAGAALAAAAWAAIWAAALAGGHLGRGGTAQIAFAAIMATFAMGETLFSPASPGAAGRYSRLGKPVLIEHPERCRPSRWTALLAMAQATAWVVSRVVPQPAPSAAEPTARTSTQQLVKATMPSLP